MNKGDDTSKIADLAKTTCSDSSGVKVTVMDK